MTGKKTGKFNGVDVMKTLFIAAPIFAAALTIAAPAFAADDNYASCHHLAGETNAAMGSASGDSAAAARDEARAGMQACNFGMYKSGAEHYRKALSLLGK
jgi:hypothetical protein